MKSQNNLVTVISESGGIFVHAIDSTDIVAEMESRLSTSATASAALGRLLTAAALMGSMQKGVADTITLSVKGGGSAGTLTAIADSSGNVRGCIDNARADLPLNPANGKLDVGGIVGRDGVLTVMRDSGAGEPYTGQVALQSGEIAEDITYYFAVSEQVPTVCALGVLINPDLTIRAAGGFILQLLPGASDAEISLIERNIAGLDAVTAMLDRNMTPTEIAFAALDGFAPQVLQQATAVYRCNCGDAKMRRVLLALGPDELLALAEEHPETELVCSYCNRKYIFTAGELRVLAELAGKK